jgi:hypothetical protein
MHNVIWGRGADGSGANHLGLLLMRLREELAAAGPGGSPSPAESLEPGAPGGLNSSAWPGLASRHALCGIRSDRGHIGGSAEAQGPGQLQHRNRLKKQLFTLFL